MSYVEVWSENVKKYYINIVKETKKDVKIEEFANTKDRSLASVIAKHVAKTNKLTIHYNILH